MNYDVAIIGGGIAGLSLAIDLGRNGFSVALLEKGSYPRHKVCGEYISKESQDYLYSLCPELRNYKLPQIQKFRLTSTCKRDYQVQLDLGGFGISRYLLEELLYKQAINEGVKVMLHTRAGNIHHDDVSSAYQISTGTETITTTFVCNATGRKSNFSINDNHHTSNKTNYVGVKYHVRLERDSSLIEIHSFPGGYCGISDVEDGKSCLCYIVNSKYLKQHENSFLHLEKSVLSKNKNLKHIFSRATFLTEKPVTVSGIHFRIRKPWDAGCFFLGDAAGCIAPLTGNGMSMALRAAGSLSKILTEYLIRKNAALHPEKAYEHFWNMEFSNRIRFSRHLQKLSEYPWLSNLSINLMNSFPGIARSVIASTHGHPF